jgi:hypothetical protein
MPGHHLQQSRRYPLRSVISVTLALLTGTLLTGGVYAQASDADDAVAESADFETDAFDSAIFDDAFFDSTLFDDADLFGSSAGSPGHFRFRLSHQLVGHVNRHGIRQPDGSSVTRARGMENNRLGLNVRYQNPFASGWLLQGSGHVRAYLPGDYEYNNPARNDWEARLNEFFIQRSGERHSFSFGRQTIVWGETLGISVLDVINTTEYRDLTVIDIEDARLNQWLMVWDYFGQQGNWSSFVNLYPEFNPAPVAGGPLFPGAPFRLGSYHRDRELFEAGTRWSRSYTGTDVAVMAARLYENPLRYSAPMDGSNRAQISINDYTLFGMSINRAIGRLLLTLDLAYSKGILADVLTPVTLDDGTLLMLPDLATRNQLGFSAGFEYGITPTQQLSVGLQRRQITGRSDTSAVLVQDGSEGVALLRYSNNLRNDELMLSGTVQAQLDGKAMLVNLAVDYRLSDAWQLGGQLIVTRAEENTALYFLDGDVRLGINLSWNF